MASLFPNQNENLRTLLEHARKNRKHSKIPPTFTAIVIKHSRDFKISNSTISNNAHFTELKQRRDRSFRNAVGPRTPKLENNMDPVDSDIKLKVYPDEREKVMMDPRQNIHFIWKTELKGQSKNQPTDQKTQRILEIR